MPASLACIISVSLTGQANLAGREEWLEDPLTGVWLGLIICCSASVAGREEWLEGPLTGV